MKKKRTKCINMCEECFKAQLDALKILQNAYNLVYKEKKTNKIRRGDLTEAIVDKLSELEKDIVLRKLLIPEILDKVGTFDVIDQFIDQMIILRKGKKNGS